MDDLQFNKNLNISNGISYINHIFTVVNIGMKYSKLLFFDTYVFIKLIKKYPIEYRISCLFFVKILRLNLNILSMISKFKTCHTISHFNDFFKATDYYFSLIKNYCLPSQSFSSTVST